MQGSPSAANRRPVPFLEDLAEQAEWYAANPRPQPAPAKLDARSSRHWAESASRKVREHEAQVAALQAELDAAGPDPNDRWGIEQSLENAEENLHYLRGDVEHHQAQAAAHERRYRRELVRSKPSRLTRSLTRRGTARARGAGRPRARAIARASSRSADSGDDGPGSSEGDGEPAAARPLLYLARRRFGRLNGALALDDEGSATTEPLADATPAYGAREDGSG